jgi:electron transfer flavoprotein alpha subunit
MTQILIVAEHDGVDLNPATAKCVTCARALPDASITIAVCASDAARLRRRPRAWQGSRAW